MCLNCDDIDIYTCNFTDWDFGVCLHYECRRKQIRKPGYFNQWIDVRALYKVRHRDQISVC